MLRPAEDEDEVAFKEAAEADEAEWPPLFSAAADCDERSRCLAAPVDDIFYKETGNGYLLADVRLVSAWDHWQALSAILMQLFKCNQEFVKHERNARNLKNAFR